MGFLRSKEVDIAAVGINEIHIRGCHKRDLTNY